MTTYNKRTEIKFNTAKDFLTANRNLVFRLLESKFRFVETDIRTLATDYFNFIIASKYNNYFCLIISKKDLTNLINKSIDAFEKQYKTLKTNHEAINDFIEERKMDMMNSKSIN